MKGMPAVVTVILLVFTLSLALSTSLALASELPYPKPFILLNGTVKGTPIIANDTLYIIALDGSIHGREGVIFRLESSISAFDYDPRHPVIAVGSRAGEILVISAGNGTVYMQAHEPIERIWLLDDARYVAVFTGSRILVYEIGKGGWFEVSPHKTTMVTRHVAFYVRQAVAGEKPGHVPGSLIAFIGYPATMRKLVLRLVNETLNGTAPVAGIKVEAFVPEYGFKTAAVSGQDGLVVLNVPAPAKAVYIVIHNYGLCSLLIIKNFKYSVYQYNYGIVMLNYLTWGVCPEFKGTGIILMNSTVSLMGRLWVPIEGLNLLGLFEDHGRLLFLGYRGNNLVIVVKKGLEQHVYEYVLPSKPVSVVMSPDSKFIIIGCKNGEVFVIDASKMKFVWAGLFGLGEIASIDVCIINGHYFIATYDMKGRVSIGVTTPNGVRLTAYADLGSLPRPFPHLEFWEDKLLVSSKNGYAVINGIDKLVTSFGNLLKRTVKGVLVEAFSEKGEPVKAEVSIYYNGNHITTITTPAVAPLLLGAHYTVVIKPLQKHYADTKTVIYVSATAKAKRVNVSVPYKNYTLTLSVFDPYGVQENLTVYVNGSKVATLYAGGNSSQTSVRLKYGYYNVTIVGNKIYPAITKQVFLDTNKTLVFNLTRLDALLTVVFSEKPREKLLVKVVYANKTVAVKECLRRICSLRAPRGYDTTIVVESKAVGYPYYEPKRLVINLLENKRITVKLVPRKYPVTITVNDSLGETVCPIKVYLNGTLIGIVQPENRSITTSVVKGVYRVRLEGQVDKIYVYKQETVIRVEGPLSTILNVTRLYTPVHVTVIDALTNGGPIERLTLSSGNFSITVGPSPKPVNVTVFVFLEKPYIAVKGVKIYHPVEVNATLSRATLKLSRKIASAEVTVVDERGEPLQAIVEIRGVGITFRFRTETVNGKAIFSAPVGVYQVCAESPFYTSRCTTVNLATQHTLKIMLYPTPIAILLRNIGTIIVMIVITCILAVFYKMRNKIIEKLLGTEEEELF